MSVLKRSISGSIIGLVQFLVLIFQNLIIVPILLTYWSKEKFGIWIAVYAFINLLKTFDYGYSIFITNEFTKSYSTDLIKARTILGAGIRFSVIIGLLEVLLFFLVILLNLETEIIGFEIDFETKLGLFLFLFVWMVVGGINGLLVKVVVPFGHYNRVTIYNILHKLSETLLILFSAYVAWSISSTLVSLSVLYLIYFIITFFDLKKKVPEIYPFWKYNNFSVGYSNFKKSFKFTLNSFLEQFNTNSIVILISNLLNISFVPAFSTMRTLANSAVMVNQITLNPISADMIKYHVSDKKDKIVEIVNTSWFFINIILVIPIIVLSPVLPKLYSFWTKNQIEFNPTFCYFILLSVIIISYGKSMIVYLTSVNNVRSMLAGNILRFGLLISTASFSLLYFRNIQFLGISICISELFASIILPLFFFKTEVKNNINKLQLRYPTMILILLVFYFILIIIDSKHIYIYYALSLAIIFSILFFQFNLIPQIIKEKLTFKLQ